MDSTIKQLQYSSCQRYDDLQKLLQPSVDGQLVNILMESQKNRTSKENLHIFLLKKNKIFTTELKTKLFHIAIKIVNEFYPEVPTRQIYYSQIGIQTFYDLVYKFLEHSQPGSVEKSYSILRPNNSTIIADTLCLLLEGTRNMIKKTLFNKLNRDKIYKLNTDDSIQNLLKSRVPALKEKKVSTRRMQTQILVPQKSKTIQQSADSFQGEYKEYVRRKKLEFVENFNQEEITNRLNLQYIELVKTNLHNKGKIDTFYEKLSGKKLLTISTKNQSNLYTNEEKQTIIKQMEGKVLHLQSKINIQNYPVYGINNDMLKQFIKIYIETQLTLQELQKNLTILKNLQVWKINQWLPFGCYLEQNDEFSLRLFVEDSSEEIQKSFKPYPKSQSVISVLNSKVSQIKDIRTSDNRHIPETKKYRKQILFCFNRKKIREMLEPPRISPSKKRLETVLLPQINHRIQKSIDKVEEVRSSLRQAQKNKLSLKKIQPKQSQRAIGTTNLTFNIINF